MRKFLTVSIKGLLSRGKILAGFLLALFLSLVIWGFGRKVSEANLDNFGELPSFALHSSLTNTTIRKEDLLGQVWIASFIFTRCAGPCPMIASNMSRLQEILPEEVRLVSFTVDPERDNPEVLTQYAKMLNADPSRWFFLRGDKKMLFDLVYNGFKLSLLYEPDKPVGFSITHSTKLVLIDKKGSIRAYYDGGDESETEKIKSDVLKLL